VIPLPNATAEVSSSCGRRVGPLDRERVVDDGPICHGELLCGSGRIARRCRVGGSERQTAGESVALTMRGVPDVSGDADPETGYEVRVDGSDSVFGGTSAVAPLWAALLALINASTGKAAGFVNPQLYGDPGACRDVTQGNNGDFAAKTGWDACTGLGSPNGGTLAKLL